MAHPKGDYCDYEVRPPHYPFIHPQDETRAVLVDTNLNTHLAVLISPLQTFSALKQQIALEHFNSFPKFGRIMIRDLSRIINDNHYLLPDAMLVKSAFVGVEKTWVVCAEVWTPVSSMELPNHADVRHIEPPHQNHIPKLVEPSSQYHHEPRHQISSQKKYSYKRPSSQGYQKHPKHPFSQKKTGKIAKKTTNMGKNTNISRLKISSQMNFKRPSSRVHHIRF